MKCNFGVVEGSMEGIHYYLPKGKESPNDMQLDKQYCFFSFMDRIVELSKDKGGRG